MVLHSAFLPGTPDSYRRAHPLGRYLWQYSASSSPEAGMVALQDVLSITPEKLSRVYPCIGHHLPPSPLAASSQRVPSQEPINRGPPWLSKGPACRCFNRSRAPCSHFLINIDKRLGLFGPFLSIRKYCNQL